MVLRNQASNEYFLDLIKQCLAMVEKQGIDISVDGENGNVKGYLICAYIPDKVMLLKTKQHNGEYCCNKCYQSGTNFRTNTNGNVWVLPYCEENPDGSKHCHADFARDAGDAVRGGNGVHGIKGPCICWDWLILTLWKVSSLTTHCVLHGVVELVGGLWFSTEHAKELFSLHSFLPLMDKRLKNICPIRSITRLSKTGWYISLEGIGLLRMTVLSFYPIVTGHHKTIIFVTLVHPCGSHFSSHPRMCYAKWYTQG